MEAKLRARWQKAKRPLAVIGLIVALVMVIVLIFVEIRLYGTGFAGKTLWDWLPLLIQLLGALAIPVVIWLGTAFFTRQQARTSEANTENQQQEELLRTYFDKISELLLDKELSTNPNMQSIVRARTLAALRMLNTERKAIILRFLHDSSIGGHSNLLQHVKGFLYSLDLSNTDLSSIDLFEANLYRANLRGASITPEQLEKATNTTPEQRAQIKPSKPAVPQDATTMQPSTTPAQPERKPTQMSQEEAEQKEHKPSKQGTDATP